MRAPLHAPQPIVLFQRSVMQERGKRENDRPESSHVPIRRRERKMQGFNTRIGSALSLNSRLGLQQFQYVPPSDLSRQSPAAQKRSFRRMAPGSRCSSITSTSAPNQLVLCGQVDKPYEAGLWRRGTRCRQAAKAAAVGRRLRSSRVGATLAPGGLLGRAIRKTSIPSDRGRPIGWLLHRPP